MKRAERIRSSYTLMIVLLLMCSIVCSSLVTARSQRSLHQIVCLKNPNSPLPATQLPEKVESENDCKHESNFFFIQQLISFIPLNSPELQRYSHLDAFRLSGNISGIPLYVSKRSFLI